MERSDPVFQRVCCIGISEATAAALVDARHIPRSPSVYSVNRPDRTLGGSFHSATGVWLKDGSHYVFDWWKTLDPDNPYIYRYADWQLDKNPVQFVSFKGF